MTPEQWNKKELDLPDSDALRFVRPPANLTGRKRLPTPDALRFLSPPACPQEGHNRKGDPRREVDRDGIPQHEPGAKLDAGKGRVGLVLGQFSRALMAVTKIGTDGAVKYSPNGWLKVQDGVERYLDAAGRHYLASFQEQIDPLSGSDHLAHLAWNILAALELRIRDEQSQSEAGHPAR